MEHIINVAFNFDDNAVKQKLEATAENRVIEKLTRDTEQAFRSHIFDSERGFQNWIRQNFDNFFETYKDEIINAAAEKLAFRLSKTKAAKQIFEELDSE